MMQRWRPLGRIYVAGGESPWLTSHASYPTPLSLPDGRLRVFFSPRDMRGRSSIHALDLALDGAHWERLGPIEGPWLEPGARGAFDDAGASVGCVRWRPDGGLECWYLGWNIGVSVPFRTAIGVAHAEAGADCFRRASPVPVLDRSAEDPFVLGYPCAIECGGETHLWYGTHLSWGEEWFAMDHVIRRAVRSADGVWTRDVAPALRPTGGEEFALSRPCVLRDAAGWHMWYCRRHAEYRLGYAYSSDGVHWTRADTALSFLETEPGWEQGVRTYPTVFDHGGRRYMLHNGAGYGRTGLGLALLEQG
jgi:hypothetical protein